MLETGLSDGDITYSLVGQGKHCHLVSAVFSVTGNPLKGDLKTSLTKERIMPGTRTRKVLNREKLSTAEIFCILISPLPSQSN